MYGLGFWYGIKCIVDDREGEVFIKLFFLFLNLCSQVCEHCQPAGDIACIQDCQRLTPGDFLYHLIDISGKSLRQLLVNL